MDFRKLGFYLLICVYLIDLGFSDPTQKPMPSEFVQKGKLEDKGIHESKIAGATRGGSGGGRSNGSGSSRSPVTKGGGALIPIYTAGAANRNRQHRINHSAANRNLNKMPFSTILVVTFAYPLILFYLLI